MNNAVNQPVSEGRIQELLSVVIADHDRDRGAKISTCVEFALQGETDGLSQNEVKWLSDELNQRMKSMVHSRGGKKAAEIKHTQQLQEVNEGAQMHLCLSFR